MYGLASVDALASPLFCAGDFRNRIFGCQVVHERVTDRFEAMSSKRLEFKFNGMPVGYFEESEYPRNDGRYRYMPYRGLGHYQMGIELREKGRARCNYTVGSEEVSFAVLDCPEYGFLKLGEFQSSQQITLRTFT